MKPVRRSQSVKKKPVDISKSNPDSVPLAEEHKKEDKKKNEKDTNKEEVKINEKVKVELSEEEKITQEMASTFKKVFYDIFDSMSTQFDQQLCILDKEFGGLENSYKELKKKIEGNQKKK